LKSNLLKYIISLFIVSFFLLTSASVFAVDYKLEIPLPGMPKTISDPGTYVRYLFIFGLSLIGFLAVGAIIVGGIMYMTAGSVGSVEKAKQYIIGALSGIALLLCSYLLLTTIDPTLKNLSPGGLSTFDIPKVQGGYDTYNADDEVTKTSKPPVGQVSSSLKEAVNKYGSELNTNNTLVLIDKSDRKMYIYKDGYIIGSTDINIGQAEKNSEGTLSGGKQGDKITPIGEFEITTDRRHSENGVYTKDGKSSLGTSFLGISAKDENGNYRGIGIHGSKDDSLRPTNGCIRVKNADSDLLFSSLKPGTKVQIRA
jgi:lipoprotein-anchoring transpeptidase ErfK/SrfK